MRAIARQTKDFTVHLRLSCGSGAPRRGAQAACEIEQLVACRNPLRMLREREQQVERVRIRGRSI
jgi:hypothetical protein